MNRWQEQFDTHPIHQTLGELIKLTNEGHAESDSEEEIERRRLTKILRQIQHMLAAQDTEIMPLDLMDEINSALRHPQILNELQVYKNDKGVDHLRTANNELTGALRLLHRLAIPNHGVSPNLLKGIEIQFDELIARIADTRSSFEQSFDHLNREKDRIVDQFNTLSGNIEQRRTETDNLISGWQSQFSEAQNERSRQFDDARNKAMDEFLEITRKIIQERQAAFQERDQELEKEMARITKEAQEKHKSILELHEIVAGDSVAAGYIQNANNENSQANFWRWASIAFIVATATWTIISYSLTPKDGLDTISYFLQALKAISVTAVLLFGAIYSAKQSNVHRHNEQKTRWLALEVKAIDPFIASLAPQEQTELKRSLSEKLFGQNSHQLPQQGGVNEHAFEAVAKGVAEVIKATKR